MSWHCSQVLVEEFSQQNCLDGEQCAQLKSSRTRERSCFDDKKKASYRRSLSGMTFEHSTAARGVEKWISSLGDSPAKTSASRAQEKESRASGQDYGPSSQESLTKYDPDSRSWKTHQLSLFGGLDEFSGTWPKWGLMRNGECWALSIPVGIQERRQSITTGSASGSSEKIKTPHGLNNSQGQGGGMTDETQLRQMANRAAERKIKKALKVPTVVSTEVRQGFQDRSRGKKGKQESLSTVIQNLPTPQVVGPGGGKLSPMWTEWLMGWPIGWTGLEELETDRYQQWLYSHGIC